MPPAVVARPDRVYLYDDPAAATLDVGVLSEHVRETLGLRCSVRKEFFAYHIRGETEDLARRIAATKVRSIGRRWEPFDPVYGEVQFERRLLEDPVKRAPGILYDGFRMMRLCGELLPQRERTLRIVHVAFTSRMFGTFGEDGRYHGRVNVCGYPSLISTVGIVEAPAKPKEYYLLKRRLTAPDGVVPFEAAKAPFAGKFVDYDDPRLTAVMKGYVLQGLFHHLTGEAFCDNPRCCLFNAHWQAEVLEAQLGSGRLCRRHAAVAARIAERREAPSRRSPSAR
ncbi:MAG TPA: DUF6775 family putative metallopeptidase [Thermoplasmata archaeon]|nr:DUF6775 family putative metallopeptidase [Thermoplasmata archaeon]